ncbi:MAG: PAS domain S-box protein [Thermodesulfobacteriota bacterium]
MGLVWTTVLVFLALVLVIVWLLANARRRRRTEAALRRSESLFRALFNNASVGMATFDPEGRYTAANESLARMLGYDVAELLKMTYLDVTPPEDREQARTRVARLVNGEISEYRIDKRYLRRDGTIFLGDVFVSTIHDQKGAFEASVVVITDQTERKRAEVELLFQKNFFEQFISQSPEAVVFVDTEESVTRINEEFTRLFGWTAGEVLGRNLSDLVGPPHRLKEAHAIHRRTCGGEAIRVETVRQRQDGSLVDVSLLCAPIFIEGRLVGAFDIYRDISKRKRAEEALRQSEEKYRTTFQGLPESITLTELETGRYHEVNDGFSRISGYSRQEVLGRTPLELGLFLNPSDWDQIVQMMKQSGEVKDLEIKYKVRDGRTLDTLFSARPITYENKDCMVAIVRDITALKQAEAERKRLEAQLQQAQKMEAVGTLASGIAHDFNNILQTISGYVQLSRYNQEAPLAVVKALDEIGRAADRAAVLVQGLLTFGRKMEPALRPMDLNRLVELAAGVLERTIPKMIGLETRLAEDLPLIKGDAVQLEQVLLNLGSNAKDAMPSGGRLLIETAAVTVEKGPRPAPFEAPPGHYVRLRVSDTGVGMDEETAAHIFEPFFTTKKVGSGTGLGLSMVYGVVRNHGGFITCASRPGQGATFDIFLPVLETIGPETPEPATRPEELRPGHETILLVDDEKAILEMGRQMLTRFGYKTLTARSGEEALELYVASANRVDLVVMDLGMPGMGGRQCLERLRKIRPEAKVIIASGYADQSQVKECLEAGASGFIAKPYRLADLLVTVRQVLDREGKDIDNTGGWPL